MENQEKNNISEKCSLKQYQELVSTVDSRYNELKNLITNQQEYIDANLTSTIKESTEQFEKKLKLLLDDQKTKFTSLEQNLTQNMENKEKIQKSELENFQNKINTEFSSLSKHNELKLNELAETFQAEFSTNEKSRQEDHHTLKKLIESLLPEASAVGIAKSYADTRNFHENVLEWYRWTYVTTLVVMLAIPFIGYWAGLLPNFFNEKIEFEQFCYSALRLAALEFPVFLMARFLTVRMNQHLRMLTEYLHKYTSAMTFVGMSKEAKDNNKIFGDDHVKKLTEGFRDTVYYNPSANLDKIKAPKDPAEVLMSLVEQFGTDGVKGLVDKIGTKN